MYVSLHAGENSALSIRTLHVFRDLALALLQNELLFLGFEVCWNVLCEADILLHDSDTLFNLVVPHLVQIMLAVLDALVLSFFLANLLDNIEFGVVKECQVNLANKLALSD